MIKLLLLLMVYCFVGVHLASADTYPLDAAALRALVNEWENLPPSWGESHDPCGVPWEGVNCTGSRVTSLKLSSMNLKATTLGGDIGQLSELRILDLSFNRDLTGSFSPEIGNLKSLNILILAGCSFSGKIPDEIGNLAELSYLALNSNKFSGTIPPSLGKLSKLYWLDLADNQLEGPLPISTGTSPGLDMLIHTKHFHLNKNQLSGGISAKLLSSQMKLIHLLLDGNKLTGEIPDTLGYVSTLEVLRLDGNSLNGTVPSNLNNLTTLCELNFANNQLTGSVPNLTGMSTLNYVDLSNNSFNPSEAPRWFSTLESLTTLVMENGKLQGPVPQTLFSFPQLQQVKLKNNQFNDSLDLGIRVSQQLRLVDFEDNNISSVELSSKYRKDLILTGNPVCAAHSEINYCKQKQQQQQQLDLTNLKKCVSKLCLSTLMLNPRSCECALPYEGTLYFRAPFFRDLSDATVFNELETSLSVKLGLENDSVSLGDPFFNMDNYLQIHLYLFPHASTHFNRTEIQNLGFDLSNQTFKPPRIFGPYYFLADPYDFQDKKEGTSVSIGMIVGVAAGVILLIILIILAGVYAVKQRKRAERERERSKSFAPWAGSTNDTGDAPKLKGARWFSYDELKKSTNNFLDRNVVGSGGYGKVYRGVLSNGQLVAIKRAKQGSTQGGFAFKTEIELLSRVHHKNLVSLVGFCFEKREQMLVYEFIPNGTLRDSLSGRSGIYLDWRRRLRITLGSARGLAYLHELANPPIIHRDVKSSNILLDENLTAKVADFGLSKLVQDAKGHVSTQVKGTMGYLDPEYYMTQQLTEKSDVYSFGVVMLELVTAKQPIEKGKYIVREVQLKLDKNDKQHFGLQELMDPAMRYESSLIGLGRFIELAMQCVEESAAGRPTMNDLVKEIEAILHNDGMNSNSTSTSSDFFNMKGSHPYKDAMDGKGATGTSSDSFDYSGGYVPSTEVKPN